MARKGTKVQRAKPRSKDEAAEALAEKTAAILAEHELEIGQEVKVEGDSETYKIVKVNRDGSVDVFGQCGFRAFQPDWLFPAQRVNNRGRTVVNQCPKNKQGLRAAWLSDNGLVSHTMLDREVS